MEIPAKGDPARDRHWIPRHSASERRETKKGDPGTELTPKSWTV